MDLGLAVQEWFSNSRYRVLKELLRHNLHLNGDDMMLDIGGGTGVLAGYFSNICKEIWVLDSETKKLRFGRKRRNNVSFICASAYPIPFVNGSFSKIMIVVSFHHFADQDMVLQEIKRVLKPDGLLGIVEFDLTTIRGKVVNFVENKLGKKNCKFYTPTELKEKVKVLDYGEINVVKIPAAYLLTAVNTTN